MKFENSVVIVTGGASGLGLAFVHLAVKNKAKVVISDIDEEKGKQLQQELGPNTLFVKCNVANEEEIVNLVKQTVQTFGAIHIVLNSAGIIHNGTLVSKNGVIKTADFHRVFNVNVLGTLNLCKYAAQQMQSQQAFQYGERGVIVNVASLAGIEGQRGQVLYGGSKAAVIGMTLPMARDMGRFGIRFVTLAPGPMKTPMGEKIPKKIVEALEAQAALNRLGEPEEFAFAVEGIVKNSYVTGCVERLDGGMRMGL